MRVQRLFPISGYLLSPGAAVRVMEVIEAIRPGRYRQVGVTVVYQQHSSTFSRRLNVSISGAVRTNARIYRISTADRGCMS